MRRRGMPRPSSRNGVAELAPAGRRGRSVTGRATPPSTTGSRLGGAHSVGTGRGCPDRTRNRWPRRPDPTSPRVPAPRARADRPGRSRPPPGVRRCARPVVWHGNRDNESASGGHPRRRRAHRHFDRAPARSPHMRVSRLRRFVTSPCSSTSVVPGSESAVGRDSGWSTGHQRYSAVMAQAEFATDVKSQ